jgi:hypothetical protein
MALIAFLLGIRECTGPGVDDSSLPLVDYPIYRDNRGVRCSNQACVSVQPSEVKYLLPEYRIVNRDPLTMRCIYCEHGFTPEYVASSEWHEGRPENKRYHRADSYWARMIKPENLIIFNTMEEAEANGFMPGKHEGRSKARK